MDEIQYMEMQEAAEEVKALALQPTNLYLTYADLALLHDCVEECMNVNRVELTQLQRMPEDTVGRGARLRWLQNRNRLLRKLESRVARVGEETV
jgi:hypothetical protein